MLLILVIDAFRSCEAVCGELLQLPAGAYLVRHIDRRAQDTRNALRHVVYW
jgi:hypothetical protein